MSAVVSAAQAEALRAQFRRMVEFGFRIYPAGELVPLSEDAYLAAALAGQRVDAVRDRLDGTRGEWLDVVIGL